MRRIKPVFHLAFFIFCFCFFAHPSKVFGQTNLCSGDPVPSVWTKEGSPYIFCTSLVVNTPVTIEPGVIVKFKKAASATFNSSITAIGTKNERIVFTAWTDDENGGDTNGDLNSTKPAKGYWYRILIGSNATAQFENVQFLYGGEHPWGTLSLQPNLAKSVSVKKSEFKHNQYAGIYINNNPDQTIENNTFSDNAEGLTLGDCYSKTTAKIANNTFSGNTSFGAKATYSSKNTIDARNNWWGDKTGPYHATLNPTGKGDRISNGVMFDPWIGKDGFDPVIIVPGVMGSWEVNGKWKIDPILRSFENLKEALDESGYTPDVDMFDFPYQWRNSNVDNAKLLRNAIDAVKEKTNRPKVDIVAHSMGGLLAREYIESDYYQDDVDQLITLGTPHNGAPEAYTKWEAGDGFSGVGGYLLSKILKREAEKAGYDGIFHYIRNRPIPSVKELLPVYDYLFDIDSNSYRIYPNNYPRNDFLENLNKVDKANKLKNIEFDIIYGELVEENTTEKYEVISAPAFYDYWEHGYPENFNNLFGGKNGIVSGKGDETVPSQSANFLVGNHNIKVNSKHRELPTEAQQDVIELLTGKRPASEIKSEGMEIKEILLVQVYCPIDIQVTSPGGEIIGTDFENGREINEISGATYINNGEDEEFIVIPNPEDGEYQILTQGTGTGEYEIEIAKIAESADGEAEEAEEIISGTAEIGKTEETTIEVSGSKVEKLTVSESGQESNDDILDSKNNSKNSGEPSALENNSEKNLAGSQTRVRRLDALKSSVRQRFKSGEIKTKKEAREIAKKFAHIRVYLKRYETETSQKTLKISKEKANRHIKKLISRVRKDIPKKITEEVGNSIIKDLNELKIE